jgi:hypothetical protein
MIDASREFRDRQEPAMTDTLPFRRRESPAAPAVRAVVADAVEAIAIGPGGERRTLPAAPGARAWRIDLAPGALWPGAGADDTGATCILLEGDLLEGEPTAAVVRHPAGTVLVFPPGGRPPLRSESGARLFGVQLSAEAYLGAGGDPAALGRQLHLQQG